MDSVMKKVILESREGEVYLSDLNNDSIIGLQSTSVSNKFILSRTNKGFEWIGEANLHSKDKCQYKSIKNACKGEINIYVFGTIKELCKWISE